MKACLFSPLSDAALFERVGFYRDDKDALRLLADEVLCTNRIGALLSFRPDLLVAYFYSWSLFAGIAGRLVGAEVVFTGGGDQISGVVVKSGRRLFVNRLLAFACILVSTRVVVSCSDDLCNFEVLCLGTRFLRRKIELAPHVVRPSPVLAGGRERGAKHFHGFTLCWMGTEGNVRRKGVDRSVRVIGMLRKMGIDANLSVAGTDGPGRDYLLSVVKKLDLRDHVFLLGPITEAAKEDLFLNADAYLQLSEYEGFGVAAAEALLSGMSVIHSGRGGLGDVIGDRGLLLDIDALDNGDSRVVEDLWARFVKHHVDQNDIVAYQFRFSAEARAKCFFRGLHV